MSLTDQQLRLAVVSPLNQDEIDRVAMLAATILEARVRAGSDTTMEQVAIDANELHTQIIREYVKRLRE